MPEEKTKIGPQAAANRERLPAKEQELFDWWTERLMEDPMRYSSLLQACSCFMPVTTSYWSLIRMVKITVERPGFQETSEIIQGEVTKSMVKSEGDA